MSDKPKVKAKDLAAGKWPSILPQLGITADVLDGKHHACPKDGSGTDRFRFSDQNGSGNYFCACSQKGKSGGLALLMCCRGWSYRDACLEVEKIAGRVQPPPPRQKSNPLPALQRISRQAGAVGPAVQSYLAARGLKAAPGLLAARLDYYEDGQSAGTFDVMLGKIVDARGKPESWHLTYLRDGRKALVPSPRKVRAPLNGINGCAIRLYPAARHLGVAEGIESAIAAHMLHGLPVWSVMNANGIESFELPKGVEQVTVFADNDSNYVGQAAAYALARRLAMSGTPCDVRVPPQPDTDWNDVLLARREAA
jgi:putative DNA primase/helicase